MFSVLSRRQYAVTDRVDATELQRGEADQDGDQLPADGSLAKQLYHRVTVDVLQHGFLLHHLLHLSAVVTITPQRL